MGGVEGRRRWVALLAAVALVACIDDSERGGGSDLGLPSSGAANKAKQAGAGEADAQKPVTRGYRDSDFVETDRNRDPFRSYDEALRPGLPVVAQRAVLMPNTPLDAMRLIAIISGIARPRAMLVDEKGVGYVASRGDFVGKPDVLQGGGSEALPVTINWRVDRIRENEVVLSREDPTAPNRPPLTRVIPLRDDSDLVTAARNEG